MMEERNFFESLPVELLELVLKPLCEDVAYFPNCDAEVKGLKSLRLVSRTVANLPSVNKLLFGFASFFSIPEQLNLLEKLDFTRIGPYVQEARFMNYPFAAPVRQNLYNSLVHPVKATEEDKNANPTDPEFETKEEKFRQRAQAAHDCLHSNSERLQQVWTAIFKACPNLKIINLASLKGQGFNVWNLKLWTYYEDTLNLRKDLESWNDEFRIDSATSVSGEKLVATVVECLAELQLALHTLKISIELSAEFDFGMLPRIKEVNCEQLHTLLVNVYLYVAGYDEDEPDDNGLGTQYFVTLLDTVGRNVKTVLIDQYNFPQQLSWPPGPDLTLPNLETLEIRDVPLKASEFASFLPRQENLRQLILAETEPTLDGNYYENWRIIFDSLRTHTKQLYVCFENILIKGLEYSIEFDTCPGQTADPNFEEDGEDHGDEDEYTTKQVALYIRNEIPWTKYLDSTLGIHV